MDVGDAHGAPQRLVGSLRVPDVVKRVEATAPHDVVITHDGGLLSAYAASEAPLAQARSAIERVLRRDGMNERLRVSRVTGPRRKIDESARSLSAEGWSTIRAETGVMLSPL